MKKPTHLLWLDIESTGTDESRHPIIEIAVKLTRADAALTACVDSEYRPIEYTTPIGPALAPGALSALNEKVRAMHTRNGLLAALDGAPTLREAEGAILDLINRHYHPTHRIPIAGSGVGHFDRRFIAAQMPRLDRRLGYAPYDIGVMRRMLQLVGAEPVRLIEPKTHRAADCIALHLAEARDYLDRLLPS